MRTPSLSSKHRPPDPVLRMTNRFYLCPCQLHLRPISVSISFQLTHSAFVFSFASLTDLTERVIAAESCSESESGMRGKQSALSIFNSRRRDVKRSRTASKNNSVFSMSTNALVSVVIRFRDSFMFCLSLTTILKY